MLSYWEEEYDDVRKIFPIIFSPDNIHFQDLIIIPILANSTNNTEIEEAILKYGSLSIGYYGTINGKYYNKNTYTIL